MMTLGDSVTAMERAHDKMREELDGWKALAERLQRDLDELSGLYERQQMETGNDRR